MQRNLGFDPLKYLRLKNIDKKQKPKINIELLDKISDYIVVRTIEILPEKYLGQASSTKILFSLAFAHIPQYTTRVKTFLEEFKQEFKKQI